MKDKSTATILCFLLGGLGAHHYYLGNTVRGIVYTLACVTFIPAIVSFFEFFVLASMSTNEFHLKYNAAYIDRSEEEHKKLAHLKTLHDLKQSGAISEEEYQEKKSKLVA